MQKNIIIVILILACGFSMSYAFIKANQASQAGVQIQELKEHCDEQRMEAERQAALARTMAAEAKRLEAQALDLTDRITACESK